jgi:hypothetical protein
MRLLDIRTEPPTLTFYHQHNIPPYLILSHTWSSNGDDEISFSDVKNGNLQKPAWHTKVRGFCNIARQKGYNYVWIDTCCIDKSSSAELSMSINSMYRWYQQADACFVFLNDVEKSKHMQWFRCAQKECARPKWFTRSWTLQELIAPPRLTLFDKNWENLGSRAELSRTISIVTGVPVAVLHGRDVREYPPQTIVSWSRAREAGWEEDRAYSLVSLLGISINERYGEGYKLAFRRLKLEVEHHNPDHVAFTRFMDAYILHMDTCTIRSHPSFELENKVSDVTASVTGSSESEDSDGSMSETGPDTPFALDLRAIDPQSMSANNLRKFTRVKLGVAVSSSASKAELVDLFNRTVALRLRRRWSRRRSPTHARRALPWEYPNYSAILLCSIPFFLLVVLVTMGSKGLIFDGCFVKT